MTVYTTHVLDGIDYLASPVTFTAGSGVTTLIGAVVTAYARHSGTSTSYTANSCVVVTSTSVRAIWNPGALPVGKYDVHVVATPTGFALKTIASIDVNVLASAGPT